jgi:hypothetical protein
VLSSVNTLNTTPRMPASAFWFALPVRESSGPRPPESTAAPGSGVKPPVMRLISTPMNDKSLLASASSCSSCAICTQRAHKGIRLAAVKQGQQGLG